jgi:DNA-binding protein HU-beta
VLKDESQELLPKLLELRAEAQRLSGQQWSKARIPTAEEINARNQEIFDRAASLLGFENFQRIFGAPAYGKVSLIDSRLLEKSEADRSKALLINTTASGQRSSKPAATVTLKHLAAALAQDTEITKAQVDVILAGLVGNIVKHLQKGERIRIGGLGILQVRKRAARLGRNPATGERLQIKASKKVAFRASKDLKKVI